MLVATRFGGLFGFPPTGISTFWPPNAILFAALLLLDERDRATCLVLAYPAYVIAELWIGFDAASSLVFAAANCVSVGVALLIYQWLGRQIPALTDLRQLLAMLAAFAVASPVAGAIGPAWIAYTGGGFASIALRWSLADFVGYLVFTPFVLTLRDWGDWWSTSRESEKLEAVAASVTLGVLSVFSYGVLHGASDHPHGIQFLPIPVMLWMALRLGPKGAALSSFAISLIALSNAVRGYGPFSDLSPENNVFSLQLFVISIVLATLLVAVLIRERDEALRLLSERDRQEKEARYRALVDLATDGIMIFDAELEKFVEANPRAAEIFACSVEDLIGTVGPAELSPELQPDGRRSDEAARTHIADALQGNVSNFEWMHRTRDGRDVPCEISLARFPDPERQLVRASIIDISDRKEAARHRSDLENRLAQAQKLEAIGKLTGGVAHDFNNLLNVVLGNLELLQEMTDSPEQLELIDAGIGATHKGATLTKNMLSFARRAHLQPTVLNLSDIVHEMDNWISRTIPASIRVETSLQPGLWKVSADHASTESALLNLLINARDALPDGGVITIETANVILDDTQNGGTGDDLEPGHYALLAVSDTGVGIPHENLERVFEPFFTTKGPGEGSGLGLSMVHGFIKQSGGSVRIYSEVGSGTTVKLYFKATGAPDPGKAHAVEKQAATPASARILIAEDQEAVNDLLVRILRKEGHYVVPAKTGDEALKIYRMDASFDLLITDIVMPGHLQGPGLARELRSLNPDLPVIFMSGYARESTVYGNGLRESDIRLMKPVSKKSLIDSVQTALSNVPCK